MSRRASAALKTKVYRRARGLCEYCQSPEKYSNATFETEHVFPISKGGKTILSNLALSCSGCNKYKANRILAVDSRTNEMVSLFDPRKDQWGRHFAWSDDFLVIVGLTAIGRATINALNLNRQNLINLRRLLRLHGEHPTAK